MSEDGSINPPHPQNVPDCIAVDPDPAAAAEASAEDALSAEAPAEVPKSVKFMAVCIPALFVTILLIVIGMVRIVRNVQPSPAATMTEQSIWDEVTNPPFLPFGKSAQQECTIACGSASVERQACLRSCAKLVPAEFARRMEVDSASEVSKQITQDCQALNPHAPTPLDDAKWFGEAEAALRLFIQTPGELEVYSTTQATEHYRTFNEFDERFSYPQGNETSAFELSNQIHTAICLRMAVAAVQLAIGEVSRAYDLYSEKYYRELETGLLDQGRAQEEKVVGLFNAVRAAHEGPQ